MLGFLAIPDAGVVGPDIPQLVGQLVAKLTGLYATMGQKALELPRNKRSGNVILQQGTGDGDILGSTRVNDESCTFSKVFIGSTGASATLAA